MRNRGRVETMNHSQKTVLLEAFSWLSAIAIVIASLVYFDELKAVSAAAFGLEPPPIEASSAQPEDLDRAAPAKSRFGGYRVELPSGRNGHFYTSARINGRSIDVLVDTGASLVSLSHEDAERAGIYLKDSDYKYRANTANGTARFAMVNLSRVQIGDITVDNVRAGVAEPGNQSVTLLGMSFLSKLKRVEMNAGKLILED